MMKQLIISEYDFDTGYNLHGLEHTQRVMHDAIKIDYLHFPGTIQEISYAEQLFFNW